MRLRPHHLLDIITQYGAGQPFVPSAYGHAVHTVAALVLQELQTPIEMIVGADDICAPCSKLVEGRCTDNLLAFAPPMSKQEYNDALDKRLLAHLGLQEGDILTMQAFCKRVKEHLKDIEKICTHPREDPQARLAYLNAGLQNLGMFFEEEEEG